MESEQGKFLVYGLTREQVISKIIDFEIDNDIVMDLRDMLENGFTGYNFVDDEVLVEQYHDYFGENSIWAEYQNEMNQQNKK